MDNFDAATTDKSGLADPESFAAAVRQLERALHAYLARRCPDAADDLLGEVWLAAFTSRHTFDQSRGTVRSWFFGIARNVLASHYRRRGRRSSYDWRSAWVDPWPDVDARLDAAAVSATLKHALAEMPPDEREVLLLVAWEELAPTEIAKVLSLPAGTVRSRLHRARARLRGASGERSATESPTTE